MHSACRDLIAASLAAVLGCSGLPSVEASAPRLPGRYEDWTQRDWTLALELADDGSAVLEYTWWDAELDRTRLQHKRARWEPSRRGVVLRYDGVRDTLVLKSNLRDQQGRRRGRGLKSVDPIHPRSILGKSRLWRVAGD